MPKVSNYKFTIYYIYKKEKLKMIKSTYNFYPYTSNLLEILRMKTNNILILANDNFANNKEEIIKIEKIMIKNCKYLNFKYFIK